MNGHNAKTNFPLPNKLNPKQDSPFSHDTISELITKKLKRPTNKSNKPHSSPSLTCLRLDTDSSYIGVWQKRSGTGSDSGKSNWVLKVRPELVKPRVQGEDDATDIPVKLSDTLDHDFMYNVLQETIGSESGDRVDLYRGASEIERTVHKFENNYHGIQCIRAGNTENGSYKSTEEAIKEDDSMITKQMIEELLDFPTQPSLGSFDCA